MAVSLALVIHLVETVERAGGTGDLEEGEGLDQDHICSMAEDRLILVSYTCACNSTHIPKYMSMYNVA